MNSASEKKYNKITEGVIWKEMLIFALPIMFGTLVQQLYNMVDTAVIGNFVGTNALAAVGGSSSIIIYMIVGFFTGLCGGVTVVVSQNYGACDDKRLKASVHSSMALAIVGGIILSVIGYVATPFFLNLLNTPEEIMGDATTYLHIYFLGTVFVFIYNAGSAVLRAKGDTKRPLYYLMICCGINIVLDLVTVCVLGLGVAGVAFSTTIAQAVSAIITTLALTREKDAGKLILREIRFEKESLGQILKIGIGGGLQSVMNSLSGMIMTAAINALGTYAVAGNAAYAKLDGIYWLVSGAFGVAISTFVGQNYGAKKYDRMKKSIWVCLGMDAIVSGALSVFFYVFSKYLLYIFTQDPLVIEQALYVMKAIAPYYAIVVMYDILGGALRGIGDVIWPMIMNIAGLCGVRAAWVLFVSPKYGDLYHVIISCPVSWILTAIAFIIYFAYRYKTKISKFGLAQ